MGRAVVGGERFLGLEDSVNNMDESVVRNNVLFDDKASERKTCKTLGALGGGSEEERSLLGPDVDLDEGAGRSSILLGGEARDIRGITNMATLRLALDDVIQESIGQWDGLFVMRINAIVLLYDCKRYERSVVADMIKVVAKIIYLTSKALFVGTNTVNEAAGSDNVAVRPAARAKGDESERISRGVQQ